MPITKRTPIGDVVSDFEKSKAPQFKGKSKAKRREMAIAAALSKRDGKSLIILTGQRLRLGISLPCADVAIHMDNITISYPPDWCTNYKDQREYYAKNNLKPIVDSINENYE